MPDDLISRSALLTTLQQVLSDEWNRRAVPKSSVEVILEIIEIVLNAHSET